MDGVRTVGGALSGRRRGGAAHSVERRGQHGIGVVAVVPDSETGPRRRNRVVVGDDYRNSTSIGCVHRLLGKRAGAATNNSDVTRSNRIEDRVAVTGLSDPDEVAIDGAGTEWEVVPSELVGRVRQLSEWARDDGHAGCRDRPRVAGLASLEGITGSGCCHHSGNRVAVSECDVAGCDARLPCCEVLFAFDDDRTVCAWPDRVTVDLTVERTVHDIDRDRNQLRVGWIRNIELDKPGVPAGEVGLGTIGTDRYVVEETVSRCAEPIGQPDGRIEVSPEVATCDDTWIKRLLGTVERHQHRSSRVGDVVDVEVAERCLGGHTHVVTIALRKQPEVVDTNICDRTEDERCKWIWIVDADRREGYWVGRVIDVVDFEATRSASTGFIRMHQHVAGVHAVDANIVGTTAGRRRDHADKRRIVLVLDAPDPDTSIRIATARAVERTGVRVPPVSPDVGRCVSNIADAPTHDIERLGAGATRTWCEGVRRVVGPCECR